MGVERQQQSIVTGFNRRDSAPQGVCESEDVPTGVKLTQNDLDQAAQAFGDKAEWGRTTSNGLFIGCELCGQTVQLTVGDTFTPDRFCAAAIAARNAQGSEPTIPEQAKAVD